MGTETAASTAALVEALSTLNPEGLQALGNAIVLIQHGEDLRRNQEVAAAAAAGFSSINSGDTAFILVCTGLVLMMTIPGLALFYGGLSQAPNVLATVMQSFAITCLVTILWLICGYSIAFDKGNGFNEVVGGSDSVWFKGVIGGETGSIPTSLYMTYQSTFAVITAVMLAL
jgi:Amt family ammonium transporter